MIPLKIIPVPEEYAILKLKCGLANFFGDFIYSIQVKFPPNRIDCTRVIVLLHCTLFSLATQLVSL